MSISSVSTYAIPSSHGLSGASAPAPKVAPAGRDDGDRDNDATEKASSKIAAVEGNGRALDVLA